MEQQLTEVTQVTNCPKHGEYLGTGRQIEGLDGKPLILWRKDCPDCLDAAKAEAAIRAEKAAEHAAAMAQIKLQGRISAAGIPRYFRESRLDNYLAHNAGQKHALKVAHEYVDNFESHHNLGRNLLFTGKPGCGKTHLAVAIGMAVMDMGGEVRYTTASDMVRRVTDTWGRREGQTETSVLSDLTSADLLILDEAGANSGSEVELRTIFNVVDGRYRESLPTLVVSNLTPKALTPYVGERVIDRLRDNCSELVAFDWASERGGKNQVVRNAA